MYRTIVIILLLLILLSVCSGCIAILKESLKAGSLIKESIKPEKKEEKLIEKKEEEFICTKIDCGDENIDQLIEEEKKQNIIACIKLQPECEA